MIDQTKKRLNLIFLSAIATFNIFILVILFSFLHYRLINAAQKHIIENVAVEFLPHYKTNNLEILKKIIEDEHFQVLNRKGQIVLDVQSSVHFKPRFNESHFEAAFSGKQVFEIIKQQDANYMISYSPLDHDHVLRVTLSLEELSEFKNNFITIVLFTIPGIFFLSYILSRFMVNQSLKPIKKVFAYQETFSSNITHELNSPMTSIKGNLEVLLRRERSPGEYRETIKSVLGRINEIIDLLNNLYLLATSKLKPLDLFKENVNIEKIIDGLIEKYEPLIFSNNIELNLSIQQNTFCECDASLIGRTIENLLDNAVKYTPPGGLIEIRVLRDKKNLMLTISNTCVGITYDEIKNFFSPFYRGKNILNKNLEGKGLGLHIVQHIIYSHGGTILTNLEKELLSFTIKIPGISLRLSQTQERVVKNIE